ncbi:MAG: response regulator [Desulfobacterales bacterium]
MLHPIEWKVVLIDDEQDIRDVVSMTLRDAGYEVFTAENGETGLNLCIEKGPQIVITDIRMPGMDGIKVLEMLKKDTPDIEVVVATAFGEMDVAVRALQLDASDFITKPVSHDALFMALKRAKERWSARRQIKEYTALLEREVVDQAQTLHQDKMMSLGRLAASVAHEINNPLSGVLNYVRLMRRILERGRLSDENNEKFKNQLELVESEISRCSQIVSSLLTFSRKSDPALARLRVEDLIQRCVLLSRHKLELSKIEIKISVDPHLPDVEGDFNQLQQCLINLIFNAIDAMPDGGAIDLSAESNSAEGFVIISVKDTGTGISEKDLPRIFEPFYTTKKDGYGVGLGLSTVYGIIERHKGRVEVTSRPGKGTVFKLLIPVMKAI